MLPLLYLHGLSSGDFVPALERVLRLGRRAVAVGDHPADRRSGRTSTRAFAERDLADRDYVYVWADGVHFNVRLEEEQAVPAGDRRRARRRDQGAGRASATATASRPSRWADLLRDCKRRGMRAPVLAVGDGALGLLGRAARGVPRDPRAALLGAQGRQRPRRPAQVGAPRREDGRWPRSATPRTASTPAAPSTRSQTSYGGQVAQGRRQDHRRPRRAARPSTTTRPSTGSTYDHQPDRVDLRHRAALAPR